MASKLAFSNGSMPLTSLARAKSCLDTRQIARLIPPADIPRQVAKTPRKKIKAATRKRPRPQTVVLPPKKPPIAEFPERAMPAETEGRSARTHSMRSRTPNPEAPPSFDERFCVECWGLPAKAE